MLENKQKLTLYSTAAYQIKVLGCLEAHWADWIDELEVVSEKDQDGQHVTTLTGSVDQAGLMGLLRRLYSLGLPIISVNLFGLLHKIG